MRAEGCWECGAETEDLHDHHVIPRSRGGTKTVPLCVSCHAKAHHMKKNMAASRLTREGLARAKARGVKLGNSNWKPALEAATRVRQSYADEFARQFAPVLKQLRESVRTYSELAEELNRLGFKTRQGKMFFPASVRNLELRIKALEINTEEVEE